MPSPPLLTPQGNAVTAPREPAHLISSYGQIRGATWVGNRQNVSVHRSASRPTEMRCCTHEYLTRDVSIHLVKGHRHFTATRRAARSGSPLSNPPTGHVDRRRLRLGGGASEKDHACNRHRPAAAHHPRSPTRRVEDWRGTRLSPFPA